MSTPTCTEAGCTHPAVALGLCHAHYTLRPRSAS
jgi:hypothetical protein